MPFSLVFGGNPAVTAFEVTAFGEVKIDLIEGINLVFGHGFFVFIRSPGTTHHQAGPRPAPEIFSGRHQDWGDSHSR